MTSGASSASYGITAGESLSQVASGLDSAFAQAGLNLSAQVVSNGSTSSLQITSADYGSQNSFSVASSGADELGLVGATFVGTDVAGTINGVAGTGDGQVLAAPTAGPDARWPLGARDSAFEFDVAHSSWHLHLQLRPRRWGGTPCRRGGRRRGGVADRSSPLASGLLLAVRRARSPSSSNS